MKNPLRLIFLALPIFPFAILVFYFSSNLPVTIQLDWPEVQWALYNTTLQASLSAILSLVLGWAMAEGLLALEKTNHWLRRLAEIGLLLPNLLPALFIILSILQVVDPFPVGILGISFVHMVMNAGFVALLLGQLFEEKIGSMAEMAYLCGASKFKFLYRIALPQLRLDLLKIFSFVFIICFTSFSVPLILGGGRGTTLEVLIYEKIHIANEWVQALYLSMLQFLLLAIFGLIKVNDSAQIKRSRYHLALLSNHWWIVLIGVYLFLAFAGYILGGATSLQALKDLPQLDFLLPALINTWMIGLAVGLGLFVILSGVLYLSPDLFLKRFLSFLTSPSQVLVAFSLLLLGPNEGLWPYAKVIVALIAMQFVPLFRSGMAANLNLIEGQLRMAQLLGASPFLIFRKISFPQMSIKIGQLAGVGSLWAFGDFGVAKILFAHTVTLGMHIESLLSSYRVDAAMGLGIILLGVGILQYFLFWGIGYVFSRKS